jgi:hypothetical protein
MRNILFERYPLIDRNRRARTWLEIQVNLQLRPNTIKAYGLGLEGYLSFCARED